MSCSLHCGETCTRRTEIQRMNRKQQKNKGGRSQLMSFKIPLALATGEVPLMRRSCSGSSSVLSDVHRDHEDY